MSTANPTSISSSRSGFRRLERAVAEQEVWATTRRVADSGRPKPSLVHFASCGRGSTGNALFLADQNDVFFCPGVDLATMRAGEFWGLDLGCGPELFFDGLTGRGEFRGRWAPHEKPFNDWSGFDFPC